MKNYPRHADRTTGQHSHSEEQSYLVHMNFQRGYMTGARINLRNVHLNPSHAVVPLTVNSMMPPPQQVVNKGAEQQVESVLA